MFKSITTFATAGAMLIIGASASWAGPISAAPLLDLQKSASPIEQTRLFCYNRYTGRFLHWGSCGGGYRPRYSRPRIFCRTTYGHRFLHWGAC
jgi:hypothetical protein